MAANKEDKQKNTRLSPIPFRVTDQEKKEIAAEANRVGLTVSAYIRAKVLEAGSTMRATKKPSIEKEELAKLLGQIGKMSSDINQIVKSTDLEKRIAAAELPRTLTSLREAASAIMEALGKKPHDH